jgi:hypothetical protein
MTTYQTTSVDPVFSCEYGNRVVFQGSASVSAALAAADKVRMCKIPGGTLVDRVVVSTGDLDTGSTATLTDKIGFEPLDGSTGDDDAFCASGATTRRGAATTTYEIFPPVLVAKDSWLTLTCVADAAALSEAATCYGKIEGENKGKA